MGSFFFPLIANMLFVSIKLLLAGKGFCEIFLPVLNIVAYYPRLTNLHMCNICLHVFKVSLILFSAERGIKLPQIFAAFGVWFRTHWTDKICLALPKMSTKFGSNLQFFKRGSTESLRHSKTFVNHKCQSHGNKHQTLRLKIEIK